MKARRCCDITWKRAGGKALFVLIRVELSKKFSQNVGRRSLKGTSSATSAIAPTTNPSAVYAPTAAQTYQLWKRLDPDRVTACRPPSVPSISGTPTGARALTDIPRSAADEESPPSSPRTRRTPGPRPRSSVFPISKPRFCSSCTPGIAHCALR